MSNTGRPGVSGLIYFAAIFCAGLYFIFSAVQGEMGLFRRAEVAADRDQLREQLDALEIEVARMENLTHRLSDDYLDLDLLDQQARDVLGAMRSDEMVVR
ncbi:FtsB family cell division protein [Pseudooceanicola sp. C21-150M6]|uniref:FtsB family cell division protein n=1 Tax=Pseudooceanicola sp. C21-150M6 TaxID=3434355 RepID=UPI003D7F2C1C